MEQYDNFARVNEARNHFKNRASFKSMMIGILLFVLAFPCDVEHVYDSYVVNVSEESFVINYQIYGRDIKSLEIEINDTVLIYSDRYVFGTVGVDHNKDLIAIVDMTVLTNNNKIPISLKNWRYEKRSKYHAEYYLTIDTALIK